MSARQPPTRTKSTVNDSPILAPIHGAVFPPEFRLPQ
jgi:hypothetical protein